MKKLFVAVALVMGLGTSADLIQTNRSYKVKATGSVYRGPSVSSGQLESVTITIN